MKPDFLKSKQEKSSDIMQHSSNAEIKMAKPTDEKIKNAENTEQSISVTIGGSKLPFSLTQLIVIGGVTVAVIATFFLVTRGNDFCFLSICNEFPFQNPIVGNFWSVAGGLGAFGILALMGISAPVSVLGGLVIWLLMQMSLH